MHLAETRIFQIGVYTIQQRPRFDNPAFAVYIIFRSGRLIGKSFSVPDIGCCEWLEREQGVYSTESSKPPAAYVEKMRAAAKGRAVLNRRRGRPRKEVSARDLAEAIES